jgi:sentrin-specific protease 7
LFILIVFFFHRYLQFGKYKDREAVLERTHIFTTYFYKRLTTRPTSKRQGGSNSGSGGPVRLHPVEDDPNLTPAEKRYDRVRKWTKKVNLFDKDFVIVPINEHAHWFVCIICFPGEFSCYS